MNVERLTEKIVQEGLADRPSLEGILQDPDYCDLNAERAFVLAGLIDEKWLLEAQREKYHIPLVTLSDVSIDSALVASFPREFLKTHCVLPLSQEDGVLTLAMANPADVHAEDVVRFRTGSKVKRVLARRGEILEVLLEGPKRDQDRIGAILDRIPKDEDLEFIQRIMDEEEPKQGQDEHAAPIVELVNSIIVNGINSRASDIHFEAQADRVRVRFRIDGILRTALELPKRVQSPCASRFKLIAGLDISERRRPQDGRTQVRTAGRKVDLRVSTLRGMHGEKIVIRILDKEEMNVDLERLGLFPEDYERLTNVLSASSGIVLITGPTGSGKTSTLYSALCRLNREEVNVLTVEDPVEYQLPGVTQVQVHVKAGVTFASALRSILRQDPDVVMLGEVRDQETAEIAFQAAQTGHLVLATLHTNDAPSAVTRLMLMGVPTYLVTNSLLAVAAQRLVRKLCRRCRVEEEPSPEQLRLLSRAAERKFPTRCFGPSGCPHCDHQGYRGRTGLFELFVITESISELLVGGVSDSMLWRAARQQGMKTLLEDGLRKVESGVTSLAEVLRVVNIKRVWESPVGQEPHRNGKRPARHPAFGGPDALVGS